MLKWLYSFSNENICPLSKGLNQKLTYHYDLWCECLIFHCSICAKRQTLGNNIYIYLSPSNTSCTLTNIVENSDCLFYFICGRETLIFTLSYLQFIITRESL